MNLICSVEFKILELAASINVQKSVAFLISTATEESPTGLGAAGA